MNKILFLFFLIFLGLVSEAQMRTATFQGRMVNIFPYRIEQFESGTSTTKLSENYFESFAVPYSIEKLKDGEYIVYYIPVEWEISTKGGIDRVVRTNDKDTFKVAINFFIKNGLKNGPVIFYDYSTKKPVVSGSYENDKKTGTWKIEKYKKTAVVNYKEDKLQGEMVIINSKKDKRIIRYKDGLMDGKEEYYENGKLKFYTSFKHGKIYGSYLYYVAVNKNSGIRNKMIKGFHLNEKKDSFSEIYLNNKLTAVIAYSPTPFQEMDTGAYDHSVDLKKEWSKLRTVIDFNGQFYTNDSGYCHVYSLNKKGGRYNEYYMINKKLKIPYFLFNESGDTIEYARMIKASKGYYEIIKVNIEYDKNRKMILKNESISIHREGMSVRGGSVNFNYKKKNTNRSFVINRPLEGYEGWIVREDSFVFNEEKKDGAAWVMEGLKIKGISEKIYSSRMINGNSAMIRNSYSFRFSGKDTIEIIKKDMLANSLAVLTSKKICIRDSSVSVEGNENIINPQKILYRDYSNTYTGIAGYKLEYKGKLFTGTLVIDQKFPKKNLKTFKLPEVKEVDGDETDLTFTSLVYRQNSEAPNYRKRKYKSISKFRAKRKLRKQYKKYVSLMPLFTYYYSFNNGKLHGTQMAFDNHKKTIYQLDFENGMSHGWQKFISPGQYTNDTSLLIRFYDSGLIDGYVNTLNSAKQPEIISRYKKGKLHGHYVEFQEMYWDKSLTNECFETNFNADTISSDMILYQYRKEIERIPFLKGKATGTYVKNGLKFKSNDDFGEKDYFFDSEVYTEFKTKLNDGRVSDTMFSYFENGSIKYFAIPDTSDHSRFISQEFKTKPIQILVIPRNPINETFENVSYENVQPDFYENELYARAIIFYPGVMVFDGSLLNLDGYLERINAAFTYYYKNGLRSQEGKMENNIKYGPWKYWTENGLLVKEIDYKSGTDTIAGKLITHKGKIRAWYPSGKLMMEGLITDEQFSYQCSQETEVAYEEVFYTKFQDENGNEILKNGSGPVADYHLNGTKRFTGKIENGERNGLWKFYDPNGNLSEIGEYVNGKKNGRWLSGDLGGVNYIDNACSMNEALEMMKKRETKDIDISETIYEMGEKISSSHLVLEKF